MKALLRGQTEFVEVPDQPVTPTLTNTTSILRGAEAPAQTQAMSDHGVARAEVTSTPLMLALSDATPSAPAAMSFAQANTPIIFTSVGGAVIDIQAPASARGDLAGMSAASTGDIAHVVDALVSLALDGPGYADHGWFIVPSASNEYGPAYAVADEFTFDVAAGEFSADWFFWA